jgi:hypothetical protein
MRRVLLLLLGAVGLAAMLRRRAPARYVELEFEDGATFRVERGPEARDLLDDVDAILAAA